jgi:MFS family permease
MGRGGLILRHSDFRRLWIGDTVSQFGSQVSMLAVPLTAVLTLHASTLQVGLLTAVSSAAFLVIGLPAGAWVDRHRRRPVLIAGNLVRAVLLGSIPAAAALGVLRLGQLYAVAFATGICTVFFDVAYQSYLPNLVGRERLVEGNGRLEASRSAAYLAGPSIAGYLVQAVGAPVAILADAVSFLWSAGWIGAIRAREAVPAANERRSLRADIGEGLRLVFGHRVLRALVLYSACSVLFLSMEHAVDVVFLVRTVGLPATGIGLLYALGGTGAVLGALVAPAASRRLGQITTILAAAVTTDAALLLIPLTGRGGRLAFYAVGCALSSCAIVVFNIVSVTYRQTLCPDHLLGRMNATMRFLAWGTIPAGGLLGGVIGSAMGLRTTLWISAAGCVASLAWLFAWFAKGRTPAAPLPPTEDRLEPALD